MHRRQLQLPSRRRQSAIEGPQSGAGLASSACRQQTHTGSPSGVRKYRYSHHRCRCTSTARIHQQRAPAGTASVPATPVWLATQIRLLAPVPRIQPLMRRLNGAMTPKAACSVRCPMQPRQQWQTTQYRIRAAFPQAARKMSRIRYCQRDGVALNAGSVL